MGMRGKVVIEEGLRYTVLTPTKNKHEAYVTNPGKGYAAILKTFSPKAEVYQPHRPVAIRLGTVEEVWA